MHTHSTSSKKQQLSRLLKASNGVLYEDSTYMNDVSMSERLRDGRDRKD